MSGTNPETDEKLCHVRFSPNEGGDEDKLHVEFVIAVDRTTGLIGENIGAKIFDADFIRSTLISWKNVELLRGQLNGLIKIRDRLIENPNLFLRAPEGEPDGR